MTPQGVRGAQFKSVRKGLDPDEVRSFLEQVAGALEKAQNHSTAMEARARAAVHRLQEVTEAKDGAADAETDAATQEPSSEQADAITRTLLLAQRTADSTVAEARGEAERSLTEARQEAERMLTEAREEAERAVSSSQDTAAKMLEDARQDARAVGAEERAALDSEVSALMARRDFLESDVDHLEKFLDAQRERLRDSAATLVEMAERVPAGLGEVHRPVLSAASTPDEDRASDDDDTGEFEPDFVAAGAEETWRDDTALESAWTDEPTPATDAPDDDPADVPGPSSTSDATPVQPAEPDASTAPPSDDADDFTLRFGDPS